MMVRLYETPTKLAVKTYPPGAFLRAGPRSWPALAFEKGPCLTPPRFFLAFDFLKKSLKILKFTVFWTDLHQFRADTSARMHGNGLWTFSSIKKSNSASNGIRSIRFWPVFVKNRISYGPARTVVPCIRARRLGELAEQHATSQQITTWGKINK